MCCTTIKYVMWVVKACQYACGEHIQWSMFTDRLQDRQHNDKVSYVYRKIGLLQFYLHIFSISLCLYGNFFVFVFDKYVYTE